MKQNVQLKSTKKVGRDISRTVLFDSLDFIYGQLPENCASKENKIATHLREQGIIILLSIEFY